MSAKILFNQIETRLFKAGRGVYMAPEAGGGEKATTENPEAKNEKPVEAFAKLVGSDSFSPKSISENYKLVKQQLDSQYAQKIATIKGEELPAVKAQYEKDCKSLADVKEKYTDFWLNMNKGDFDDANETISQLKDVVGNDLANQASAHLEALKTVKKVAEQATDRDNGIGDFEGFDNASLGKRAWVSIEVALSASGLDQATIDNFNKKAQKTRYKSELENGKNEWGNYQLLDEDLPKLNLEVDSKGSINIDKSGERFANEIKALMPDESEYIESEDAKINNEVVKYYVGTLAATAEVQFGLDSADSKNYTEYLRSQLVAQKDNLKAALTEYGIQSTNSNRRDEVLAILVNSFKGPYEWKTGSKRVDSTAEAKAEQSSSNYVGGYATAKNGDNFSDPWKNETLEAGKKEEARLKDKLKGSPDKWVANDVGTMGAQSAEIGLFGDSIYGKNTTVLTSNPPKYEYDYKKFNPNTNTWEKCDDPAKKESGATDQKPGTPAEPKSTETKSAEEKIPDELKKAMLDGIPEDWSSVDFSGKNYPKGFTEDNAKYGYKKVGEQIQRTSDMGATYEIYDFDQDKFVKPGSEKASAAPTDAPAEPGNVDGATVTGGSAGGNVEGGASGGSEFEGSSEKGREEIREELKEAAKDKDFDKNKNKFYEYDAETGVITFVGGKGGKNEIALRLRDVCDLICPGAKKNGCEVTHNGVMVIAIWNVEKENFYDEKTPEKRVKIFDGDAIKERKVEEEKKPEERKDELPRDAKGEERPAVKAPESKELTNEEIIQQAATKATEEWLEMKIQGEVKNEDSDAEHLFVGVAADAGEENSNTSNELIDYTQEKIEKALEGAKKVQVADEEFSKEKTRDGLRKVKGITLHGVEYPDFTLLNESKVKEVTLRHMNLLTEKRETALSALKNVSEKFEEHTTGEKFKEYFKNETGSTSELETSVKARVEKEIGEISSQIDAISKNWLRPDTTNNIIRSYENADEYVAKRIREFVKNLGGKADAVPASAPAAAPKPTPKSTPTESADAGITETVGEVEAEADVALGKKRAEDEAAK